MGVVDVVDGAVRWYARSALGVEYGDGVAVLRRLSMCSTMGTALPR